MFSRKGGSIAKTAQELKLALREVLWLTYTYTCIVDFPFLRSLRLPFIVKPITFELPIVDLAGYIKLNPKTAYSCKDLTFVLTSDRGICYSPAYWRVYQYKPQLSLQLDSAWIGNTEIEIEIEIDVVCKRLLLSKSIMVCVFLHDKFGCCTSLSLLHWIMLPGHRL